jgi:3',5'-cyclic-AMP phosphodiesterase
VTKTSPALASPLRQSLFAGLAWLCAGMLAAAEMPAVAPADAPTVARIALVSDTHISRAAAKEDQPLYRGRFDRVIAAVNAERIDFVVIAGDLTQEGLPEDFDDFKAQTRGFTAPVFFVPGNHDIGPKPMPGKPEAVTAERIALYEQKIGPSFYTRSSGGIRIIGLNSPVFGSGLPTEQAMWTMLEKELARPTAPPTIVFMHYPPFVKKVDEPGGTYWNIEPAPRRRLLALLASGGVRTVLTGHLHYPLVTHHEATTFITTLPVSFGLPRGKQPQGWTLVTLRANGEASHESRPVND